MLEKSVRGGKNESTVTIELVLFIYNHRGFP